MRYYLIIISILVSFMGCESVQSTDKSPEGFHLKLAPQALGNKTVNISAQLILDVNVSLKESTVTSSTLYIQEAASTQKVPTSVQLVDQQILLKPEVYLKTNTHYEIVVTTKVLTFDQRHLSSNLVIPFLTSADSPDVTSPSLNATLPANNATNMERFGVIYFEFSEAIPSLYAKNLQILVKDNMGITVPGQTQYFDAFVSFIPDNNLTDGTHYTATLDTTNIKDFAGHSYSGQNIESIDFDVNSGAVVESGRQHNTHSFATSANINAIVSDHLKLYIGGSNGLDIVKFDFNNTTAHFVALSHLPESTLGNVYTIEVNSSINRAYVGSSKGFFILDISDLNNSFVINNYPKQVSITNPVQGYGIDVCNQSVYLAAANHGLIQLDITHENQIQLIHTIDTNSTVFDAICHNGEIVLADYNNGVNAFDINTIQSKIIPSQTTKHARAIFATTQSTAPYFVASGIHGVKLLSGDVTPHFGKIDSASYISNIITAEGSQLGYALVKHIGVGIFGLNPFPGPMTYQYIPYDITAVGFMVIGGGINTIFVANKAGEIHAYTRFPT